MKKIIILTLVLFSLGSCKMVYDVIDDAVYSMLEDIEFYDFAEYDLSDINNFYKIGLWIQKHVVYKADIGEQFSSPENTVKRRFGDCEDISFIFMNIAYLTLGIKLDMVVVNTNNRNATDAYPTIILVEEHNTRSVVEGGIGNHIVVRWDGVNYGAQLGDVSPDQEVMYIYTFDEVFPNAPKF